MSWKEEKGILTRGSSSQETPQKKLKEAQKQTEEQRKLTKYWKKQT